VILVVIAVNISKRFVKGNGYRKNICRLEEVNINSVGSLFFISFFQLTSAMLTTDELTRLKFPIGPFIAPGNVNQAELESLIATVEAAPFRYRAIADALSSGDLGKTYRAGGWNVQQLFAHVADMQLLHFFRMKKALTENDYKELTLVNMDGWAHTADGLNSSVADSLAMFESITKRFVYLTRSLTDEQKEISYYHPVRKITLNQKQAIAMSAWHVSHHYEHLRIALGTI
jgi:hypothetical protein